MNRENLPIKDNSTDETNFPGKGFKKQTESPRAVLWEYSIHEDKMTYVSPQSEKFLGYKASEWTNLEFWTQKLHDDDRERVINYSVDSTERGEDHEIEYRFRKKDGSYIWIKDVVNVQLKDGEPVAMKGFMVDITERKINEEQLRLSKERFRAIFDMSPIGIALVKLPELNFIEVNKKFTDTIGYSAEELRKMTVKQITFPEDMEKENRIVREAIDKGKESFILEKRYSTKNSDTLWVKLTGKIFDDEKGNKLAFANIEDITSKKLNTEVLRQAEENYKRMFLSMKEGVIYFDSNNHILSVNPAAEEILGFSQEEFLGKTSLDKQWHNIREDGSEMDKTELPSYRAFKECRAVKDEIIGVYNPKKNTYIWVEVNAIPLFKPGEDKAYQVFTTFHDISDTKKIRDSLKERVKELTCLYKISHLVEQHDELSQIFRGVVEVTPPSLLYPEVACCRIQFDGSEFVTEKSECNKICDECSYEKITAPLNVLGKKRGGISFAYITEPLKNGKKRFLAWEKTLLESITERLSRIIERKEAEAELEENRYRLELALQATKMGVWDWDMLSGKVTWDAAHAQLFGIKKEDFGGTIEELDNFTHPDDRKLLKEKLSKSIKQNLPFDHSYRIIYPDETIGWMHSYGSIIKDADGKAVRFLGTTRDVTEEKLSINELEAIYDSSLAMICIADIKTTIFKRVNPAFTTVLGYEKEELLNKSFMEFIHPEDIQKTIDVVEKSLKKGISVVSFENRYRHKDGSYRNILWNSHPVPEQGFTYATAIDVTEINEIQRKINDIITHSREMFYMHDDKHFLTYVSRQCKEILGYTEEEMKCKWTEMTTDHPVNEMGFKLTEKVIKTGERQPRYELQVRHKNGSAVWIEVDESPVKDDNGNVIGLVGSIQDITEHKIAEDKLKKANEVINNSPAVAFRWRNAEGWPVEYVSKNVSDFTGYSSDEFISGEIDYKNCIHTDDVENVSNEVMTNSANPHISRFEHEPYRLIKKDGKVIWVEDKTHIVRNKDGKVTHFEGIILDITDRKKAENELFEIMNLEKTLSEASSFLLKSNNKEDIRKVLTLMLDSGHADRIYLFENFEDENDGLCMKQIYEVCTPGVKPEINNPELQHLPYKDGFGRWREILSSGLNVSGSVIDFPKGERDVLQPQGILSILALPFYVGDKWAGFIGLDETKKQRKWTANEIRTLTTSSELISGFLTRLKAQTDLKSTLSKMQELNEHLVNQNKIALELSKKAEEASEAKSNFFANMSHEIRTPTNGVLGMLELLIETSLSEDQKELAETALNSGRSLLRIINDILDLSKIEAGKMELSYHEFDLMEIMDDFISIFSVQIQKKDIDFISVVSPGTPIKLKGDSLRLRQVLTNIIANAFKFTDKGKILVRAETFCQEKSQIIIKFSVRDTGIGIKEKDQKKLFGQFTQLDSSYTKNYQGTGLGLAISKQLVILLDGEIGVESPLESSHSPGYGPGSEFWFTAKFKDCKDENNWNSSPPPLKGSKVLILCSDEDLSEILKAQTRGMEAKVSEFKNTSEALDGILNAQKENKPYQLLIADDESLSEDTEIFKMLSNKDTLISELKILFLCANKKSKNKFSNIQHSKSCFISKPFKQSQFINSINKLLTGKPLIDKKDNNADEDFSLSSYKVLVAEDNSSNSLLIKKFLDKYNTEADFVENGKQALEAVNKSKYDIILMDCMMPVLDGYETTKAIRSGKSGKCDKNIPIISITANALEGDREKCLKAGMSDYIAKPLRRKSLEKAFKKWLRP